MLGKPDLENKVFSFSAVAGMNENPKPEEEKENKNKNTEKPWRSAHYKYNQGFSIWHILFEM